MALTSQTRNGRFYTHEEPVWNITETHCRLSTGRGHCWSHANTINQAAGDKRHLTRPRHHCQFLPTPEHGPAPRLLNSSADYDHLLVPVLILVDRRHLERNTHRQGARRKTCFDAGLLLRHIRGCSLLYDCHSFGIHCLRSMERPLFEEVPVDYESTNPDAANYQFHDIHARRSWRVC